MLAATRQDWCHFYLEWQEPEYLRRLDRLIKNDNRYLKVAYLLLSWTGAKRPKRIPADEFRVVSNRMSGRGQTELVLCGTPGRVQLTRMDRDRSRSNEDLDRAQRGDLVKLEGASFPGFEVARKFRLGIRNRFKKIGA